MPMTWFFMSVGVGNGARGSLDIGEDLGIVVLIGNPTDLGALHGIPEARRLG